MAIFTYLGSHLINLQLPNEGQLPWADVSPLPRLLLILLKLMLVITFKLRAENSVILYSLALITTAISGYRLYVVITRSHIFDPLVQRVAIVLNTAIFHFLLIFLITVNN